MEIFWIQIVLFRERSSWGAYYYIYYYILLYSNIIIIIYYYYIYYYIYTIYYILLYLSQHILVDLNFVANFILLTPSVRSLNSDITYTRGIYCLLWIKQTWKQPKNLYTMKWSAQLCPLQTLVLYFTKAVLGHLSIFVGETFPKAQNVSLNPLHQKDGGHCLSTINLEDLQWTFNRTVWKAVVISNDSGIRLTWVWI